MVKYMLGPSQSEDSPKSSTGLHLPHSILLIAPWLPPVWPPIKVMELIDDSEFYSSSSFYFVTLMIGSNSNSMLCVVYLMFSSVLLLLHNLVSNKE